MGCGCKNKGNETPQVQQTTQTQNQPNTVTPTQNSVQEAIKKTIEKYYTVKKG